MCMTVSAAVCVMYIYLRALIYTNQCTYLCVLCNFCPLYAHTQMNKKNKTHDSIKSAGHSFDTLFSLVKNICDLFIDFWFDLNIRLSYMHD